MLRALQRLAVALRARGPAVVVVSGLPRSGTSMMMRMLDAGGLRLMTDGARKADVDNPKGYHELERIKRLESETDKSYLREARGKAIKVISFLLKDLPDDNRYRVLLMRRDLDEVLASQNKMTERLQGDDPGDDHALRDSYLRDLARARMLARRRPNFQMLEVHYREAIHSPREVAQRVRAFLGAALDVDAMAAAVDPALYRNRHAQRPPGS